MPRKTPKKKTPSDPRRPSASRFVRRQRVYIGFRVYDAQLKKARHVRGCTIRAEGWDPYALHRYIVLALTGGKRQPAAPYPPAEGTPDEND